MRHQTRPPADHQRRRMLLLAALLIWVMGALVFTLTVRNPTARGLLIIGWGGYWLYLAMTNER